MYFGILTKNNSYTLYQKAKPSNLGIHHIFFLLRCHSKFLFTREFYTLQKVIIFGSIECIFIYFARYCIHILSQQHKVTSFKKTPHHQKSGMLLVSLYYNAHITQYDRQSIVTLIKLILNPPLVCFPGASLKGNPNLSISTNNIYIQAFNSKDEYF